MTPVVVLYWTDSAKMSAIPANTISYRYEAAAYQYSHSPMPESKSGTIAASVIMSSCRFLRKSDHCGVRDIRDQLCIYPERKAYGRAHFVDPLGHLVAVATVRRDRPAKASVCLPPRHRTRFWLRCTHMLSQYLPYAT